MKSLNAISTTSYNDLMDYNVVEQNGEHIGTLSALWTDDQKGQLEYLGVKTGWILGSNHVVPVESASIDEANRVIRLPYDTTFIKGAPTVDADSEISDAQEAEIRRYYGGYSARTSNSSSAADLTTTSTAATTGIARAESSSAAMRQEGESVEVPLREEQLTVGKRSVESGQVRLRKVVRTETVNQPVELRREEVIVERVPAGEVRQGTVGEDFAEKEIVIPVSHEEAVVSKETHVTGAVRVRKTEEVHQETVGGNVRKEDVQVEREASDRTSSTDIHRGDASNSSNK